MAKASKIRASKQAYISPSQLILEGFETPFATKLGIIDACSFQVKTKRQITAPSRLHRLE